MGPDFMNQVKACAIDKNLKKKDDANKTYNNEARDPWLVRIQKKNNVKVLKKYLLKTKTYNQFMI